MSEDETFEEKEPLHGEEEEVDIADVSELDDDLPDDDLFADDDVPIDLGDEEDETVGFSTEDRDQNY